MNIDTSKCCDCGKVKKFYESWVGCDNAAVICKECLEKRKQQEEEWEKRIGCLPFVQQSVW